MVYAGAVASGAIAGQSVTLFGYEFADGFPAYVAMATAGTVGYLIGSILGWALGDYLGRPWLEEHGRWFHLNTAKLDRAERWFDRWEGWAVFLGRVTPVIRSFISVPAGSSGPASARTSGSRSSARRSGASRSRGRDGRPARTGRASTTRSATWTTSSQPVSSASSRGSAGASSNDAGAPPTSPPSRDFPASRPVHSGDRDPARRRQGAVRAAHPGAQGAVRRGPGVRDASSSGPRSRPSSARPPRISACRARSASRTGPTPSSSRSRRWASGAATR